jgi:hypothetical protein
MSWVDGDDLSPANLNAKGGVVLNVTDENYGAVGNGTTDDTAGFVAALSAATWGDTVFVPSSRTGYRLTSTVTVPQGVTLMGGKPGMRSSRWIHGTGLSSGVSGQGTQLRLSNMTNAAVVLLTDAATENLTFFYPGQAWGLTSISSSFVTYAPTIQLGTAADTAGVYSQAVRDCHFLGSTVCIDQPNNAQSVNDLTVENCSGVLLGPFLRVRLSSDPLYVRNLSFNPAYVEAFVADGTVNGSLPAFRTKSAQLATVFEFGQVPDVFATNIFAFGTKHIAHYNRDFYTGDLNEECGGSYNQIIGDVTYQAFRVDRNNNIHPLNVINGWFTPVFRPNGDNSDGTRQGVLSLRSSVQTFRCTLSNLRVFGVATSSYLDSYSSRASYALVADAPLTTPAKDNVYVTNCFFDSLTESVVDSNLSSVVQLDKHTLVDVSQPIKYNAAMSLVSSAAIPSAASGQGYFYVNSGTSLYWVNGSGVSTLIA